jgi:surface antigen
MNNTMKLMLCGACALGLFGCETATKQDVGVLTGGALGALVGSQLGHGSGRVVATAAGAVVGALIGGSIGAQMDREDQMQVYNTLETTRTHQPHTWVNPDSGHQYTVTPTRTYQNHGKYCREYSTQVTINGKLQSAYGRACRQPDGSWQVAN